MDASQQALDGLAEADLSAERLTARALAQLQGVAGHDDRLAPVVETLQGALAGVTYFLGTPKRQLPYGKV